MGLLMNIVSKIWSQHIMDAVIYGTAFMKITQKESSMDQTLSNISLIALHINLWQGDKALKQEDLAANGIDVSRLPPGKLASLGCKRTISKDATKEFIAIKRAAHTACAKYGVKFGESSYAVPDGRTAEVCAQLDILKKEFVTTKASFLSSYEEKTEEWINQNDYEWRDAIRKSIDPVGKVSSVLSLNFSVYKINPVEGVANGLDEEVGGLHAQLCKEIRTLASVTLKTSYLGKSRAGKRALRPLKAMADKLLAMSFLDQTIMPLVTEIKDCLTSASQQIRLHKENVLEGKGFNETVGMLTKLSSLGIATVYEENADLLEEETEEDVCGIDKDPIAVPIVDIPDWDF